jgi:hypothetical protein
MKKLLVKSHHQPDKDIGARVMVHEKDFRRYSSGFVVVQQYFLF